MQRAIAITLVIAISGVVIGELNKRQDRIESEINQKQQIEEQLRKEEEKHKLELDKKEREYQKLKLSKAKAKVRVASATYKPASLSEKEAKAWIISHEGGLRSVNPTSFACGKPQANPCDKLLRFARVKFECPAGVSDGCVKPRYMTKARAIQLVSQVPESVQDAWMDRYVEQRYGSYFNAYKHWLIYRSY